MVHTIWLSVIIVLAAVITSVLGSSSLTTATISSLFSLLLSPSPLPFYVHIPGVFTYPAAKERLAVLDIIPGYAPQLPVITNIGDQQRLKTWSCDPISVAGSGGVTLPTFWIDATFDASTRQWCYDTGGVHHITGRLPSQKHSDHTPPYWNVNEPNAPKIETETKVWFSCVRGGWDDVGPDFKPTLVLEYGMHSCMKMHQTHFLVLN